MKTELATVKTALDATQATLVFMRDEIVAIKSFFMQTDTGILLTKIEEKPSREEIKNTTDAMYKDIDKLAEDLDTLAKDLNQS